MVKMKVLSCVCLLFFTFLTCNLVRAFDVLGWVHPNTSMRVAVQTHDTKLRNACDFSFSKRLCNCIDEGTEADCSHLHIEKLPSQVSFPPGIRVVNFQDNLIDCIKSDTFDSTPDVSELDLSNNRIDFLSSDSFQSLSSLRRLVLSHNRIWSLNSRVFQGLQQLKELDLSYNEIGIIPRIAFQPLSGLKVLNLESNPIASLDSQMFEYVPNLVFLNMDATMLVGLPEQIFTSTKNLKRLSMANNLIVKFPSKALKALNKVQNLDLSNNKFTKIPSNALSGMKSLRVLYLDRMPDLTYIDKYSFNGLSQLNELHCSYNFNLEEIHHEAFVDNTTGELLSVEQVFLQQNRLTTLPFKLLPWNEYMEVHIRDNPWNCDCHMIWTLKIDVKNGFKDQITCAAPYHLQGRQMMSIQVEDLICGLTTADILVITLGVAIAFLIAMLIIAMCAWKRHFSNVNRTYYQVSKLTDSYEDGREDVVYEKTTYGI